MNWINRVLGRQGTEDPKSTQVAVADPDLGSRDPQIPRNLFLEEEAPPLGEPERGGTDTSVKVFLDRDFFRIGREDGYGTHSADTLGINQRRIRAEFRFAVEQLIDETKREILLLKTHLINAGSISDSIRDQLQLRIDELKTRLEYLEREKELSVDDEGLVSAALHKYHDGFVRGVQAYEEEKIFASSTGLFK